MNKFQVNSKVEDFVDSIALQNVRRLSPFYIARQVEVTDRDMVFDVLMRLADYKVRIKYEVQCVECGSGDFVLYDKNNFNQELKECRYCHSEYVPDEEKIWVTFDIAPDFRETVKESAASYGCDEGTFFGKAGYSIKEARKNSIFSQRESFYSNWSIDLDNYNDLLNKVKEAPEKKRRVNYN